MQRPIYSRSSCLKLGMAKLTRRNATVAYFASFNRIAKIFNSHLFSCLLFQQVNHFFREPQPFILQPS